MGGWFRDCVGGTRDHLGVHNSGNVVVKRSEAEAEADDEGKAAWIVIDGQQRLTTTSLLVASLRDAAIKEEGARRTKLVRKLERVLYTDAEAARRWGREEEGKKRAIEEGEDVKFCRLLPSFYDRRAFFVAVTEGLAARSVEDARPEEDLERSSLQLRAKRHFDVQIRRRLDSLCGAADAGAAARRRRQEELESLSHLALHKMGLTLVEVQNRVNLAQVFLWLQEKTLFGEAALLFNPSPGVDFSAADLERNLLLASVAGRSLSEQERFYREKWLEPLEGRCPDPTELTVRVSAYVEESLSGVATRSVSALEETVRTVRKRFPKPKGHLDHASEYAKFYSFYEWRLRQAAMLPPRRVDKVKEKKEQEDDKDLTELVDEATLSRVTESVLRELAEFVAKGG